MSQMTIPKTYKIISILLIALLLSIITGCQESSDSGEADTGQVSFNLVTRNIDFEDEENEEADSAMRSLSCSESGSREMISLNCNTIKNITANIRNSAGTIVANGGPWSCEDRSGTIKNVPSGINYELKIMAKDESGKLVYVGTKRGLVVIGGQNNRAGDIILTSTESTTISGFWKGITMTDKYGQEKTTMNLSQNEGIISGELKLTDEQNIEYSSSDLTGSGTNFTASFRNDNNTIIKYRYEGSIENNTYSGNVYLYLDDKDTGEGGTFNVKNELSSLVGTWIVPFFGISPENASGWRFILKEDGEMSKASRVSFQPQFGWGTQINSPDIISWELAPDLITILGSLGTSFDQRRYTIKGIESTDDEGKVILVKMLDGVPPGAITDTVFYKCMKWNCTDVPHPKVIYDLYVNTQ